ncbi:MAG: NADP-dependent malic enzyme [Halorhodospira halophila]|uniref:NADP-dependent malic enzyme n=1 Tax=Halorhodospira TaxID=85108 RepID=UPI001911885F|nr:MULTISPECIES: NADP-dependent malic enzyme [Halorhodospira]MBK5937382.1 NADP-dependent malic enzyme [Halorhodospira halophila]MBK5943407.1 NADP-dependent malic enzyme [Halorhodospira halophila]MCC3751543.1 NADP-dependent malic enzyme [Halorhodospira halophila]MCG5526937.1 NADP-dependent malic enzyme [Halorhodospira halophila]MCG5534142.1 NADP-dependent malic enzyme [Halorhodospira sp. 9621]
MSDDFKEAALEYHRQPTPGKIEVIPSKPLANQRDLALAYSPGVASACEAIVNDPREAAAMTTRGNLVAVITNGSAVLGLGNIGPLASKPVMEGKGVLFKKFAGIDVFDIEVDEPDAERFVDIVSALEPTFGGINLEDIKAPECFEIEEALKRRMNIPVFHDDQHGTAIITAAAIRNGLRVVGKRLEDVTLVCSGAGAAAIACLDLLVAMGLPREQITVTDRKGVVYKGRKEYMDPRKEGYARETAARSLREVIEGADIFLGLSAPGVLNAEMVNLMADRPIIMALANPVPEILPEEAREARPDAVLATGRSDYPNQVNNVLCFPFIFRGALDVGASAINEAMKIAAVEAIADLATEESSEEVVAAYGGRPWSFGADYLIPKPFDPRLISRVAPAVAHAAMESGVACRPINDFEAYRLQLQQYVFQSGLVMKPIFERAREQPKRVVYTDGEEERILRAVQLVVDENLARPIVVGRRRVVEKRLRQLGLRVQIDEDFELVDPEGDPRYRDYWQAYYHLMARRGVTPARARTVVRTRNTVIGALMVHLGDADALVGGIEGRYQRQMQHIQDVIGRRRGVRNLAAMNVLIMPKGTFFLADTYVNQDPNPHEIAEMTLLAADEVRRFGTTPKVALLSHSNFGTSSQPSAEKMRHALELIQDRDPALEVEGEMHGDAAISEEVRRRIFPDAQLEGEANLLIMPGLDAANISFNLLKATTDSVSVGPILLGTAKPAHLLTPSSTVRAIVNLTALSVVEAQMTEAVDAGKQT